MSNIYFFAKLSELNTQAAGKEFQAVTADQFRVTSLFSGQLVSGTNPMAYAVRKGRVFIVEEDSSSGTRVNLILGPTDQPSGLPPVKYFIYRGLLRSDFWDGTNPAPATTSKLLKVINTSENPAQALSTYTAITDAAFKLDHLFVKDTYQFSQVNAGDTLGHFDGSGPDFGFEIILDEPDCNPTMAIARKDVNLIEAGTGTVWEKAISRLEVLNYMDPAAYFGLCSLKGFGVIDGGASAPKTRTDVYDFVKKFATKNTVYVDVRDSHYLPQDFIEASNSSIKLNAGTGTASGSAAVPYRNVFQWPFHMANLSAATSNTNDSQRFYKLRCSLSPVPGVVNPLLTLHSGYFYRLNFSYDEHMRFSARAITAQWTADEQFLVLAVDDSGIKPVASMYKLQVLEHGNAAELDNQVPDKLPEEREFAELNNLFALNRNQVPQPSDVTDTRIHGVVRRDTRQGYINYKGSGAAVAFGATADSWGNMHFAVRNRPGVILNSKTNTQEEKQTYKTSFPNLVHLPSEHVMNHSSCWEYIITQSQFDYDYQEAQADNSIKIKQREIPEPSFWLHKIRLTGPSVNCLELRILDPVIVRGRDLSPGEPFLSICYSAEEHATFLGIFNDPVKFSQVGPRYLTYELAADGNDGNLADPKVMLQPVGTRGYFRFRAKIRGLLYNTATSSFEWKNEYTTIDFYSLDGLNYVTAAYATQAFAALITPVWNDAVIPDTVSPSVNPFSTPDGLQNSLQTELGAIVAEANTQTAGLGSRLLEGEIRSWYYRGRLDHVTFNMAFRLPFYILRPTRNEWDLQNNIWRKRSARIPYRNVIIDGVSVDNNPCDGNFSSWFARANTVRGFDAALGTLARTGQRTLLTTLIAAANLNNNLPAPSDSHRLYALLGLTRNDSFSAHNIPAFMAKVMNDENPRANYTSSFHYPARRNHTRVNHSAAQVSLILSAADAAFIVAFVGNYTFRNRLNRSDANGYYVVKHGGTYFVETVLSAANNSGFTIGMGFDLGQQTLAKFLAYTQFNPAGEDLRVFTAAIGASRGRGVALWESFQPIMLAGYTMAYDLAVQQTKPFMEDNYLNEGLNQLVRNAASPNFRIYLESGAVPFWDAGGEQYLNEVEKFMLTSQLYNAGALSLGNNANNSATNNRGRLWTHAFNTHDIRWLRVALDNASMYAARKALLRAMCDRINVIDHYSFSRDTLA